jgi:hypothetical protein
MKQLVAPEILRLPPPPVPRIDADAERVSARAWRQAAARQAIPDRRLQAPLSSSAIQSQLDTALPGGIDQWRPWRSLAFFAQSFAQQQPSTPATLDLRLYGHPAFAAYEAADREFQQPTPTVVNLAI